MGVLLAVEKLGRTFVLAFGMLAARKAPMVEEELQQAQIVRAELATQEEVTAQAAIDVLDHRTGAHDLVGQILQRLTKAPEARAELAAQGGFLLPTPGLTWVQNLHVEQGANDVERKLIALGQGVQIGV